ncbi:protein kinase family protein [Niallia endozanthoxylica]|uniref:Protein kinase family protein n=1 Tax=Niallia endozanthoxylica TaxID=2036016 RepID=A0A5J5HHE0_9BACI|nr:protein kinase family protein [Niallia endozanthoxylica]KAA9020005.1 protein kinase family protein [Niallia endozanthoxylica]
MKSYSELARSVTFSRRGSKTVLKEKHKDLEFAGAGRSAYVFKIKSTEKVIKVFFPPFTAIAKEEARIYRILQGVDYYPSLYDAGENYIVIDYLSGATFFDCLTNGKIIYPHHIQAVDHALLLAKQRGLNPSDIHLRNILLTSKDEIKLIDVARFGQKKDCHQWADLKKTFYQYYNKGLLPKKMPVWLLNRIADIYMKRWLPELTQLNGY